MKPEQKGVEAARDTAWTEQLPVAWWFVGAAVPAATVDAWTVRGDQVPSSPRLSLRTCVEGARGEQVRLRRLLHLDLADDGAAECGPAARWGRPSLYGAGAGLGQFHALAELQPKQDSPAANGWYATGVMLHDAMLALGYKPERGDTWIVNEVGSPSDSTGNTDVFNGVAGAREGFRDFIRGLYAGSGGPVLPGMVFAADAAQLAPDVADYAQKLASWYADTPFWEDMQRYVVCGRRRRTPTRAPGVWPVLRWRSGRRI